MTEDSITQGKPPDAPTNLDSWLTYRLEPKPDGKLDKIPTDPHTGHRKDKDAFGLYYGQARRLSASSPHVRGIGLALQPNDMLTCIDLDGCRDAETGKIEKWAWTLIRMFGSYTEASVSGTGVHIFVWGAVTGANVFVHDGHKIEMYSQDRFIGVTGDHVEGTPTDIRPGQGKLNVIGKQHPKAPTAGGYQGRGNDLDDAELLNKARNGRNGEAFRRLYDQGDLSGYAGDHSRADAALVEMLGFWTNYDRDRTERLWQQSALGRNKPFRADYIERTLDFAFSGKGPDDGYQPDGNSVGVTGVTVTYKEMTPVTLGVVVPPSLAAGHTMPNLKAALRVTDLPDPQPVDFIVSDVVTRGMASIIYGMGGSLKSILGAHLSTSVAAGRPDWLGHKIDPCPVLYVDVELDWRAQGSRFQDIANGLGLPGKPEDLFYLSAIDMDTQTAIQTALDACAEYGIGLVVLDSLTWAMRGDAEASTTVLDFMTTYIAPFEAAGISVLMLDHVAKPVKGLGWRDMKPFGSVFKFNKGRCIWQVHGERPEPGDTGKNVTFRHEKSSFGPMLGEHVVRANFAKGLIKVARTDLKPEDIAPESNEDRIMQALRSQPMFVANVADLLQVKHDTAKNLVSRLRKDGKVVNTGEKDSSGSLQVKLAPEYDPNTLFGAGHAEEAA